MGLKRDTYSEVRAKLRAALHRTGLTRRELAERLGYDSWDGVKEMIRNNSHYLSREQARRLRAAFGYSEPYLCIGQGSLTGSAEPPAGETTPARGVMAAVRDDLERRGETLVSAAARLHYKSSQSLWAMFGRERYMSPSTAERFVDAFGYNFLFLTEGAGTLYDPGYDGRTEGPQAPDEDRRTVRSLADVIVRQEAELKRLRRENSMYLKELEALRAGRPPGDGTAR